MPLRSRLHRGLAPAALIGALLLALLLFLLSARGSSNLAEERDDAQQVALSLAEQVRAACAEGGETARDLGPACADAVEVVTDPEVLRGERGARGLPGSAGPRGDRGPRGEKGRPGRAGQPGGVGTAGADGLNGPRGADGQNGAAGPEGEPPLSWVFTTPDGTVYDCAREPEFERNSPRYACSPRAEQASPEPPPGE